MLRVLGDQKITELLRAVVLADERMGEQCAQHARHVIRVVELLGLDLAERDRELTCRIVTT